MEYNLYLNYCVRDDWSWICQEAVGPTVTWPHIMSQPLYKINSVFRFSNLLSSGRAVIHFPLLLISTVSSCKTQYTRLDLMVSEDLSFCLRQQIFRAWGILYLIRLQNNQSSEHWSCCPTRSSVAILSLLSQPELLPTANAVCLPSESWIHFKGPGGRDFDESRFKSCWILSSRSGSIPLVYSNLPPNLTGMLASSMYSLRVGRTSGPMSTSIFSAVWGSK